MTMITLFFDTATNLGWLHFWQSGGVDFDDDNNNNYNEDYDDNDNNDDYDDDNDNNETMTIIRLQ